MRISELIKNKRGNAVIEFALTLPILLLVLFGITELGRALMVSNVMHQATREGARMAAVTADLTDTAPIVARVNEILAPAGITAGSTYSELAGEPSVVPNPDGTVTVTVDVIYHLVPSGFFTSDLFGDGGLTDFTMSASTVMRREL